MKPYGVNLKQNELRAAAVLVAEDNVLCIVIDTKEQPDHGMPEQKRHSVKLTLDADAFTHARAFVDELRSTQMDNIMVDNGLPPFPRTI